MSGDPSTVEEEAMTWGGLRVEEEETTGTGGVRLFGVRQRCVYGPWSGEEKRRVAADLISHLYKDFGGSGRTLIGSMRGGSSTAKLTSTTSIRIVVAGDHGTGKSSLIITAAKKDFPENVPPLLPPTELREDMFPDSVPIIIDTSSSLENACELADELKRADAVVLTYAWDQPSTLERLSTFWLPELRRLEVKVPVIVAVCKLDLDDGQQADSLEQVMSPILQQFPEIETCIACSAYKHIQVSKVFYYAQKAVIYPTAPLFDCEGQTLKPRCIEALKRIFILCDDDRDGVLSDAELNDFQVKCFNAPLLPLEIAGIKTGVQEKLPEGVHEDGLTLLGFLCLHAVFLAKGRTETTWTVLRKFGYNNDIMLGDDLLPPPITRTQDQDGALNADEPEDLFSTAPESAKFNSTSSIQIVVAGDHGTGKSSLIITAATWHFPEDVPPMLPPTKLSEDSFPDGVPITIIDTSSSLDNRGELAVELKRADAVVLTYACDQPSTLERLSTFWLPELRRLEVKVPVIVAGCKLDLKDEQQADNLEQVMSPILQQFPEIETCIACSAYKDIQIQEVFYYAQKAVLHPTAPLFGPEAQTLKPRLIRALKRIFILCDHDRDGALSDVELNDFQVKCFNAQLKPLEIADIKNMVQEKMPEGVHENGITLLGFIFLHETFIKKGRVETTWTILRKFGYNNDVRIGEDQLPPPIKRSPDQSVELTSEVVEFLRGVFSLYDSDGDGALNPDELEDLFSTAPESPWSEAPYVNAAEKNASGGLSLDSFLAEWDLMTLLDPALSVENLIYIGYSGEPSSAVRVTRRRCVDCKKQHSDRNVFQCFVFGSKEAGKSSLLNSFVGRPFADVYAPTTEEQYTVNIVDEPGGTKKTLILREIPEDAIADFLINDDALATCDIAIFVHDSSNESLLIRATELLVQVACHGESFGYEVPCLIVAAKDDLDPYPTAIQDSTRISQDMGIEAPIPISTKLGDFNDIFQRIVRAAEHPHLSIPETEAWKSRKQYHRLLNGSLMVASVANCWARCVSCLC